MPLQSTSQHIAPVFDPILSEHRVGVVTQQACTTVYVLPPVPLFILLRTFSHSMAHDMQT
jgi:hypothetical protein